MHFRLFKSHPKMWVKYKSGSFKSIANWSPTNKPLWKANSFCKCMILLSFQNLVLFSFAISILKCFILVIELYRVFFFNWSAQISVLKRKTLFNQRGSFVHRGFHGTESLIGWPTFFILVLKIGRTSKKKHHLCLYLEIEKNINWSRSQPN